MLSLAACSPDPLAIPGPARSVTRDQAIATAYTYTQVQRMPEQRHVLHGEDPDGLLVHTPDTGLERHGFSNGWWKPGTEARGVAYEAGPFPVWRVNAASIPVAKLRREGHRAWRYRAMRD